MINEKQRRLQPGGDPVGGGDAEVVEVGAGMLVGADGFLVLAAS
ncbi:hypothetical protein ACFQ51_52505 [Streptomyces kaempferi]